MLFTLIYLLAYVFANIYNVFHMSFLTKPLLGSYIITEIVVATFILILIIAVIFIIIRAILMLGLFISYIGPFLAVRRAIFFVGVILFLIARVLSIWWYATGPA